MKCYASVDKYENLCYSHIKIESVINWNDIIYYFSSIPVISWSFPDVLESSNMVPAFYVEQTKKFLETYYPIEVDHNMTIQEKIPYMVEW